jgi:hypothetical protein
MGIPYRARVNERWFLNLPGFRGGAYVVVFVEDTSECGLRFDPYCDDNCTCCPTNFEPRMALEISSGDDRVQLGFDVDTEQGRANTFHKLDTLIASLRVLRKGLGEEMELYERRERELEGLTGE